MEDRGDIDWQTVKAVHDSWDYSHSGLNGVAQIVVAIVVIYFTAGAASGLVATAAGAAGASTAAGATWAAAGWANAAATAAIVGAAGNAAVSTINNQGDLGAVWQDVTADDALRGYAVAGITAGLTNGLYDGWTSTETGLSNALPNNAPVSTASGLSTAQGIGQFAGNQLLQNGTSALLDRALGGDAELDDALQTSLVNTFAAAGFNAIGNVSQGNPSLENGSLGKAGLHAVMGGLAAEAAGGDFRTGALAAGVNELLVDRLAEQYSSMAPDEKNALLVMNSQLIGALAAAGTNGVNDSDSLQIGAQVAGSATQYNRLLHPEEARSIERHAEEFAAQQCAKGAAYCISAEQARGVLAGETLRGVNDDVGRMAELNADARAFLNDLDIAGTVVDGQTLFGELDTNGDEYRNSLINADLAPNLRDLYNTVPALQNLEGFTGHGYLLTRAARETPQYFKQIGRNDTLRFFDTIEAELGVLASGLDRLHADIVAANEAGDQVRRDALLDQQSQLEMQANTLLESAQGATYDARKAGVLTLDDIHGDDTFISKLQNSANASLDFSPSGAFFVSSLRRFLPGAERNTTETVAGQASPTPLPEGYRELGSVGAAGNTTGGLPAGYRRVVSGEGDIEILAPSGRTYGSVDEIPSGGGGEAISAPTPNNVDGNAVRQYPDGSFRTPDGKFASQGGLPAPGTRSAQEYTQFLRDRGFDVVGEELTVRGAVGNRRYDAVVRTDSGELWGIEYKSGGAQKTPQQNFNDMYINRHGADGAGQISGEKVVGNITIYLP